jgi:hypothetical protein
MTDKTDLKRSEVEPIIQTYSHQDVLLVCGRGTRV